MLNIKCHLNSFFKWIGVFFSHIVFSLCDSDRFLSYVFSSQNQDKFCHFFSCIIRDKFFHILFFSFVISLDFLHTLFYHIIEIISFVLFFVVRCETDFFYIHFFSLCDLDMYPSYIFLSHNRDNFLCTVFLLYDVKQISPISISSHYVI